MNYKIYCKNNIKRANQENNDLILKQYLEKYRVYTADGINSLKNIADSYDLRNKKSILFIGGILGEKHIRKLLYKNMDSYFITIDSLEYQRDYTHIFEHKVNNIHHWFGAKSDLLYSPPNYDFIIACRDCNNIFDTIYIDSGVMHHIPETKNIFPILFKLLKLKGIIYIEENSIDFILPYNKKKEEKNSNYGNKSVIQYNVDNIYFYERNPDMNISVFDFERYNRIPMKQLLESIYKVKAELCNLARPLHQSEFFKCTKTQEVDNLYPHVNDNYTVINKCIFKNKSTNVVYNSVKSGLEYFIILDNLNNKKEIYLISNRKIPCVDYKELITNKNTVLFNKLNFNLILAKSAIYNINIKLGILCKNMKVELVLDNNSIILSLLCDKEELSKITTAEINTLIPDESCITEVINMLSISSSTPTPYEGRKYNTLLRAIFIYIGSLIRINNVNIEKLHSLAVNPISVYLLTCFYNVDLEFSEKSDKVLYDKGKSCKECIQLLPVNDKVLINSIEITIPLSQDNINKAKAIIDELLDPNKNHLICSKIKLD